MTPPRREATVVTSNDGVRIECSTQGDGPGLVLVHGGMQTARSFDVLASALVCSYRVVRYDRRGRGRNAAGGSDDGGDRFTRDTNDLVAVVDATEARYVFGLSSGAILTMGAALASSRVEKIVLYEPPLAMGGVDPGDFSEAFLAALARDRLGAAMATIIKGTGDREPLTHVPRFVLSLLFGRAIRNGVMAPIGESLRDLLLTMPADIAVQRQGSKTLAPLSRLSTPTLLLGGDRSNPKLNHVLDCIEHELPNVRRTTIHGSGHLAADNEGKPEDVARAIDAFLQAPTALPSSSWPPLGAW